MGIDKNKEYNKKHIKYINFDLDTEKLLEHFPNGTSKPYAMLKSFLELKGFEHRQYSGYISKEPIDEYQVDFIAQELGKNFTWLKNCIQKFDISNVPENISIKEQIEYNALKQEKINKLAKIKSISRKTKSRTNRANDNEIEV